MKIDWNDDRGMRVEPMPLTWRERAQIVLGAVLFVIVAYLFIFAISLAS